MFKWVSETVSKALNHKRTPFAERLPFYLQRFVRERANAFGRHSSFESHIQDFTKLTALSVEFYDSLNFNSSQATPQRWLN
jgi:hypothetical protein